jgi:tRNA 2-thiouridine synthesizing protein A
LATDRNTIDARGLKCPLPVLKLEKRLAQIAVGTEVVVLATDPMAKVDIPLHCRQNGHTYDLTEDDGAMRFVVIKAAEAAR